MQINGMNSLTGPQRIVPVTTTPNTACAETTAPCQATEPSASSIRDEVNVSQVSNTESTGLQGLHAVDTNPGEIRVELVNRIRAEIAAGTYETEEKLDIALSRMLQRLESGVL